MSADPVSIETPEARRLAGELAAMTGKPVREAVTEALQAALERARGERKPAPKSEREKQEMVERLLAIGREYSRKPVVDPRHPDDMLYDADGLPKE